MLRRVQSCATVSLPDVDAGWLTMQDVTE